MVNFPFHDLYLPQKCKTFWKLKSAFVTDMTVTVKLSCCWPHLGMVHVGRKNKKSSEILPWDFGCNIFMFVITLDCLHRVHVISTCETQVNEIKLN